MMFWSIETHCLKVYMGLLLVEMDEGEGYGKKDYNRT